MRLHRNAKTTPKMRELMVRRVHRGPFLATSGLEVVVRELESSLQPSAEFLLKACLSSDKVRQYHLSESVVQKAVNIAAAIVKELRSPARSPLDLPAISCKDKPAAEQEPAPSPDETPASKSPVS